MVFELPETLDSLKSKLLAAHELVAVHANRREASSAELANAQARYDEAVNAFTDADCELHKIDKRLHAALRRQNS